MKKTLLLTFSFLLGFQLIAQVSNFNVEYTFNNTMSPTIIAGEEALTAEDAVAGGAKVGTIDFATLEGEEALSCEITANNATNYINSFLRMNIKPKAGYTVVITEITANQSTSNIGANYLFRIGANLNQAVPQKSNLGKSTDNIKFKDVFSANTFTPSTDAAKADGTDYITAWLCARGTNTGIFNWNIDKVVIKGQYIATGTETSGTVNVSSTTKQNIRLGIDAERLWYWKTGAQGQALANAGVKELQAEFVRVGIECGYEREEGIKDPTKYDKILDMMTAMKTANPDIKFFASPRPLDEAYSKEEVQTIWGGPKAPWAPVPAWIMTWIENGTKIENGETIKNWKLGPIHTEKLAQYYADYLNLMHSNGFKIDYMDVTNEKNNINHNMCKYLFDNIPTLLNPGVHMPELIAPSAWCYSQGVNYLDSFTADQLSSFTIAASHNTGSCGKPLDFTTKANAIGKEPWNTELHNWVGIRQQEEILTSNVFFNHIRAGFVGLDTWLFYGPLNGKDHTMIWSNNTTIERSTKYEIFKKVVNNANGGNYLETTQPAKDITAASFIKDNVMTIFALNRSNFSKPDVTFNIADRDLSGKEIEVTQWQNPLPRNGVTSQLSPATSGSFTKTLDPASLYCFKITLDPTSGIFDRASKSQHLRISPNPVADFLNINHGDTFVRNANYTILNTSGMIIREGSISGSKINTSTLPTGFYILKIKSQEGIHTGKFLKQ